MSASRAVMYKSGVGAIVHLKLESGAGIPAPGLAFNGTGLIIALFKPGDATPKTFTAAGSSVEDITTLGTFQAPSTNKIRWKEYDSTNCPGWYEVHIAAADVPTSASFATMRVCVQDGVVLGAGVALDCELDLTAFNNAGAAGANLSTAAAASALTVNVTQFGGTNLTASGGRPEVNSSHLAGTAFSTGVVANFNAMYDDVTGYAGNIGNPYKVDVFAWHGEPVLETAGFPDVNVAYISGTAAVATVNAYDAVWSFTKTATGGNVTAVWRKNGVPVAPTGTPQIQVLGSAATNMTTAGSLNAWTYEWTGTLTPGTPIPVQLTATIDGSTRTQPMVFNRDAA